MGETPEHVEPSNNPPRPVEPIPAPLSYESPRERIVPVHPAIHVTMVAVFLFGFAGSAGGIFFISIAIAFSASPMPIAGRMIGAILYAVLLGITLVIL